MANLTNFENINYCGKEAKEIFAKQVYDIDIQSYGITLMDEVKGRQKVYTGEISDLYQPYTCEFSPEGQVSLAEAYIEPEEIKVNLQECYDAFWNTFLVEQTRINLNGGIPSTFEDFLFTKIKEKMAKEYQEIMWKGDKAYTGATKTYLKVIDGFEKILKNGGKAQVLTAATFTDANIVSEVESALLAAINSAQNADVVTDDFVVFMNHQDVKLLELALGKICCGNSVDSIFKNYTKDNGAIHLLGYKVIPTMQTKNTVIVGPAKNLVLGFDTFDARIQYQVIDMRKTTGDNMFRVIALTNIATTVVAPELFVFKG